MTRLVPPRIVFAGAQALHQRRHRLVQATRFHTPDRCGPNAVRNVAELRRALAETRARGYGVALEEGEPGMSAVAAVIRASAERDAPAVGTLSLAGPAARLTAARRKLFARELLAAAREMSAPGAEEFVPQAYGALSLPPQRTFSSIVSGGALVGQETRHLSVAVEQDVASFQIEM